jgi:hypothetical protein
VQTSKIIILRSIQPWHFTIRLHLTGGIRCNSQHAFPQKMIQAGLATGLIAFK